MQRDRQLDIGGTISQAFDLYISNFRILLTIALGVYAVIGVLSVGVGYLAADASAIVAAVVGITAFLLIIAAAFVMQGMLIVAADDIRDGSQDLTAGEMFERVKPRLPALLGTTLLMMGGLLLGVLALVIPFFVLLTWWYFAAAVVVLEDKSGGAALGRSRELVRGNGWRVFGLIVVTIVLTSILQSIIGAFVKALAPDGSVEEFLASFIGGALVGPLSAMVPVLAYFQLRGDGGGGEAAPGLAQPAPEYPQQYTPPPGYSGTPTHQAPPPKPHTPPPPPPGH